jgi:hypothetical protein
MKQLLKVSLFVAVCAFTTTAFAQISFGVKAGLNLANVITDDDEVDPKMSPSFQVGAVVEIGLTESIALQTGLSLQGKGFKVEEEFLGETFKSTANPLYLQVPAHILYKGSGFFVGVGPYVGYGVAGKFKTEIAGESDSENINFGNDDDADWKGLDFGVGAQAGVSLGAIRIGAGYDLGLSNVVPGDDGDELTVKNGVINVFATYMFGN